MLLRVDEKTEETELRLIAASGNKYLNERLSLLMKKFDYQFGMSPVVDGNEGDVVVCFYDGPWLVDDMVAKITAAATEFKVETRSISFPKIETDEWKVVIS